LAAPNQNRGRLPLRRLHFRGIADMIFYFRKDEPDRTIFLSWNFGASILFAGGPLSGFVGIVNLDGAPVDPRLLQDLTHSLSFRGPDAQDVWSGGPAGLGHALLQTRKGTAPERQPAQLDGRLWIVADARIDARAELIGKLKGKNRAAREPSLDTPDAELILRAYDAWGEDCVEHLLGDFTFAIWDAPRQRLFCARDHFGVKLLYFSFVGSTFIFSNTLACVQRHPAVSRRLNDLAIADFLLFDSNQDPATTSFVDIQRLPPAHCLTLQQGRLSTRRYWQLSVTEPIHYSRDEECIERFRELLDASVADRLRTNSAGIFMSGGLDSSTVAASARRVLSGNGNGVHLQAYTEVFDSLIRHEERHYARRVADTLHIPIEFLPSDAYRLFDGVDHASRLAPEPTHTVLSRPVLEQLRRASSGSRVILTGDGADPGLSGRISVHFRQMFEKKQFARALADAVRYFTAEGRLSRLYLRKRWGLLFPPESHSPGYPPWLAPGLEKRLGLRERWDGFNRTQPNMAAFRPEAHDAVLDSTQPNVFEDYDAGWTGIPVETRFPFYDLRLVHFLLALPRLPWCCDKQLLREAGRGVLPEEVRLRRKSPLQSDPLLALLSRPESAWVDRFQALPDLAGYVIRERIPPVQGEKESWAAWIHLRPLSLNFWLRDLSQ
jgi:asparagine synthase (glutamine-hydrolysing)